MDGTDTGTALKLAGDNGSGTKAWSQLGYSGANGTAHWANYNTAGVLLGQIIIGPTGNIGIGNRTSSPNTQLHVHTASGADAQMRIEGGADAWLLLTAHSGDSCIRFGDSASDTDGMIAYDHGTRSLLFNVAGATERARIDSNGDLNLGNNPTNQYGYKLNIEDSAIIYAQTASSNGTELKLYLDHSNTIANFGTVSTSHLAFVTANTERLRIKSDGGILQTKTGGNANYTISRNESVGTTNQVIGVIDFASNTAHTVQARRMGKTRGTSNVC